MGFVANLLGIGTGSNPQNVQTTNYAPSIQQGLGAQSQLLQAFQAMANGQGPNLAQTQLQNAQQQNTQQAAGLIGSQKGINPGLAAQQILRQYGMVNQNAANESAQLAQQQQLAGLQGAAGEANQLAEGAGSLQNQQNGQQYQNAQFNANQTGGLLGGAFNALGGAGAVKSLFSEGGMVKGREEVPGDSPENDNVPAMLSPGEIVVPKEVVEGRPEDAKAFIQAVKAHKGEADPQGYAKVLAAHRHLHERVSALEAGRKGGKK